MSAVLWSCALGRGGLVLEVIAVVLIARRLSARAEEKGYPGYVSASGVVAYVICELVGMLFGVRVGLGLSAIAVGWVSAAVGVIAVFQIVRRLPDRTLLRVREIDEVFR